jgi:hypothetical protein
LIYHRFDRVVIDIYAVISCSVTRQTQAVGIRMAIGATAASVQLDVFEACCRLALVGIVLETAASSPVAKGTTFAAVRNRTGGPGDISWALILLLTPALTMLHQNEYFNEN